jgi:hypothetical protein
LLGFGQDFPVTEEVLYLQKYSVESHFFQRIPSLRKISVRRFFQNGSQKNRFFEKPQKLKFDGEFESAEKND